MHVQRLGLVDYHEAWDRQREIAEAVIAGRAPDTLLLLEHPSVFTAGRRTSPEERPSDGTPVIDVDRGGKITWHGPGQLVGYPIVRLGTPVDVVAHVRRLEAALIEVCEEFGVEGRRVDGRSGVWTADGQRKIAAIGVRVSRGVTTHGFALNCSPDLAAYRTIIPCGIVDAGVTSLAVESGNAVTVIDALPVVERRVTESLAGARAGVQPVTAPA